MRTTVQLGFATITAPISGRLGAVNVAIGDLVTTSNGNSTSTPLVTITQMDPLQVNFNLPEGDLALLHKALAAPQQGAVTLTKDGDPTPIGKGTLSFVDSTVDTASGTIADEGERAKRRSFAVAGAICQCRARRRHDAAR